MAMSALVVLSTMLMGLVDCTNAASLTSEDARRKLLMAHVGVDTLSQERIVTKRSELIMRRPANVSTHQIKQLEVELQQRPTAGLNIHFYYRLDQTRTEQEIDYITNKLMPTTATILSRSIRVRQPSGRLPLSGYPDENGKPIPGPKDGIDADIVLKVSSRPANSEECRGVLAGAFAYLIEDVTNRPVYGLVELCQINPNDFSGDLSTTVHEVLHALVMDQEMFKNYPGYSGKDQVMKRFENGRAVVVTPNVVKSVHQHFDCDNMHGASLEDDGGRGTAGSHWEQRIYEGEMMDGQGGLPGSHHFRHVLTNVTLGLLQDSNWYDVKYGSGGHNVFGYKGGCNFAIGTHAQAMEDPLASRYLCKKAEKDSLGCLPDYSGDGICYRSEYWDGFFRLQPVARANFDCMPMEGPRGQRCIEKTANNTRMCIDMACSDDGELLVAGEPCDPDTYDCPDADFMCKDPGLLTCLGELNDCSGRGDCLMGHCYCHSGFGGADCSLEACVGTIGCPDGTACPESGFCGVEACGTWSSGALDQGVPCTGAVGPPAGDPKPAAPLPMPQGPLQPANSDRSSDPPGPTPQAAEVPGSSPNSSDSSRDEDSESSSNASTDSKDKSSSAAAHGSLVAVVGACVAAPLLLLL